MARRSKKKKKGEPVFKINQKFENVKILVKSERPKEAIAYIYLTYADLVNIKYKKPRLPYQTIREYAIICVNELNQKPESVYTFIKRIEDIIYGGVEPGENEIKETTQLFSKLYNEITGKTFSI